MKLLILNLFFFCILNDSLQAQFTEDFESWFDHPAQIPLNWSYPQRWSTSNPITEFSEFSVLPSTDAHSGTKAAAIKSVLLFGKDKPGELLLGDALYDYVNLTIQGTNGIALDQYPVRLSGWYKIISNDPNASAEVEIGVSRKNTSSQTDSILLSVVTSLPYSSEYSEFEVPLNHDYTLDALTDSLFIHFSNAFPGAILLIDDLNTEFVTSIISPFAEIKSISLSPNPHSRGKQLSCISLKNFQRLIDSV
jgi:hypothetical protein